VALGEPRAAQVPLDKLTALSHALSIWSPTNDRVGPEGLFCSALGAAETHPHGAL